MNFCEINTYDQKSISTGYQRSFNVHNLCKKGKHSDIKMILSNVQKVSMALSFIFSVVTFFGHEEPPTLLIVVRTSDYSGVTMFHQQIVPKDFY